MDETDVLGKPSAFYFDLGTESGHYSDASLIYFDIFLSTHKKITTAGDN